VGGGWGGGGGGGAAARARGFTGVATGVIFCGGFAGVTTGVALTGAAVVVFAGATGGFFTEATDWSLGETCWSLAGATG
jgi:hypothetical protein